MSYRFKDTSLTFGNGGECLNGGEWNYFFEWCDCVNGYSGDRCEEGSKTNIFEYE